jgi:hypothetical protein
MLTILPRFLETLINMLRKRKIIVGRIPHGEILLFSLILGTIHYYYQNEVK